MIPLLVACAEVAPPRPPSDRPPAETGTPPPDDGTGAPPVPAIAEALSERCPDPAPEGAPPAGDDLHRATLADPSAVCNDGSPAVLWVRAGTPEHAGDWVMYLDGGRYCEDHETCATRWCGEASYDASKMSSRWAPERRAAHGLTGRAAANPFRDWTQVSFQYCSSDRWTGTRRDVVLDGDPPYRLHFAGADIVDAALRALAGGLSSDDGAEALPPLADAGRVLFTGSSSGGKGAAQNLDRVAEALPGVAVYGLVDAIFDADRELLDPATAAVIAADLEDEETVQEALWGTRRDASCAASGLGWECGDGAVLLREHVTTPFLHHHDVDDPDIYALGFAPLGVLTAAEYRDAALATFGRWEAEGSGGSFLLSTCATHTWLSADDRFLAFRTADADGGLPLSLAEAAEQLVGGATLRISGDSTCP